MTQTWAAMARSALAAGRRWRTAGRPSQTEPGAPFCAVDLVVLALLAALWNADEIVCADPALRNAIGAALTDRPCREAPTPGGRSLILRALGDAAGSGDDAAARDARLVVVHGLSGLVAFQGAGTVRLRLLAGVSSALWQCGLALAVSPGGEAAAEALAADLNGTMHGEWIDPLALYERVQVLTARLGALGAAPDVEAGEPEEGRVAALEREIASLRRAALVQQHLLLADAAERARNAEP